MKHLLTAADIFRPRQAERGVMSESSRRKQKYAKAEAKSNSEAEAENNIIDLVGGSQDDDGEASESDEEDVVLVTSMAKKRPLKGDASTADVRCNADVIDLVDDALAPSRVRSSLTPMNHNANKRQKVAISTSSRINTTHTTTGTTSTTSDVEILELLDSDDDAQPGNNEQMTTTTTTTSTSSSTTTTNDIDKNHQTAQHLVLEPGDNAILTHGILEKIHVVTTTSCSYCWTCLGHNGSASNASASVSASTRNNDIAPSIAAGALLISPPHIQQNDVWSCGYRNYQMMLAALLPRITKECPQHHVFQKIPRRLPPTPISLPSLRRIQASLEEAWNEGFDPNGAIHYRHSIVEKSGSRAHIGAMEVANLCWYHGIDAVVVQFIKCSESRRLLPNFILAYFGKIDATTIDTNDQRFDEDATLLAQKLLSKAKRLSTLTVSTLRSVMTMPSADSSIRNINSSKRHRKSTMTDSLLPLYLQWEGHSVTLVGIEAVAGPEFSANFLVLDPMKQSQRLQSDLDCQQQHQHQKDKKLPMSVKIPWKQISNKDLQIIMCTGGSMTYSDRDSCKLNDGKIRVLTAAEDAVEKYLLHHQR